MQLSRRRFLLSGVAGIGTACLPGLSRLYAATINSAAVAAPSCSAFQTLCRIAYGPRPGELERLNTLGLEHYLAEQLNPEDASDALCNERLAKATLHIEYKDGDGYKGMTEDRPLTSLHKSPEDLWALVDGSVKVDNNERVRPLKEVRAATWIRAVYSKWQLREIMVEFWHNHFNVQALSNPFITATFPLYDAVMRKHCFGNFRSMLEEVAQSPAMLIYLNNAKSIASPANENYARELFELHTLGSGHYYNNLYNRWREVPGALEGRPIGYIDQDVYEAARAFTGWTIEDGTNTGRGLIFPKTGKFTYFDGWHDNYQKRVLGVEFDPNTPPLADGQKVLDLVAAHPGTAVHLCTKLCQRLLSDHPPESLVNSAAKTWQESANHPDQIKQTLKAIILSPEFARIQGEKVKRPYEFAVSFLRATNADFTPNDDWFGNVSGTGYKQFEWPTPAGHPDNATYWLNTNSVLSSWNLLALFNNSGHKIASFDPTSQIPPQANTSRQITQFWYERLTGKTPDNDMMETLLEFMPYELEPEHLPDIHSGEFTERLTNQIMLMAMLPDFQLR